MGYRMRIRNNNNKKPKQSASSGTLAHKNTLKGILINARSIINKREEMEALVYEKEPDFILITESWAKDKHSKAETSLRGYDCHRNDRNTTSLGGGCIIYAKSELKTVMIQNLTETPETDTVWCKYEDITIGVCYNTTANTTEEQEEPLLELIKEAGNLSGETIITGDFNHETIDWELMEAGSEGQKFMELTEDQFLTQHIKEPTRGNNILDLILSTNPNQITNVKVGEKFGTSDHNIIEFEIKTKDSPSVWKSKYRDYRKADYSKIKEDIQSDSYATDENADTNTLWNNFKEKISKVVEENIPLKERRSGKPKPMWWNRKIRRLRKNRLKWWNRYKESKRDQHEQKYKEYQKLVHKEIRKSKNRLEKRLGENIKTDRKGFFKYAKSKTKVKESVGPIEGEQGNLIKEEKEMVKVFSKFFKSVLTREDTSNIPEPETLFRGSETDELHNINLTTDRVKKRLNLMNPNKAPGNDDINPAIIAATADQIAEQVTDIFKKSIDEGIVPEDWRTSNITPIHKKDSRSKAENYRGVHLTAQLCKSLESIIKEDIVDHLEKHKLIRNSQHGFQAGKSCVTNLLEFLEEVTKDIDEGKPVDIIYMDFMKAFDKVPHKRLIKKIKQHGIGGKLLRWIEQWLTNRKQRVVLKGEGSEWEDVISGVPQGSVLGPLLFIIYINDIETGVKSTLSKFADDCKIKKKVENVVDATEVQTDLNTLVKWSEKWQMSFHPDKCKVLHLGYNNQKNKYYIKDAEIKKVKEEKDLGVLISEDLKPKKQIANIVKKANRLLGMISRTLTCKNKANIMNLYKTLVRPILDYAAAIWNPHQKKDIEKLERVQRRATRMIRGLRNLTYEERLKKCNLTTLESRRRRYDLIETFKIMKNIYKIDKNKLFPMKPSQTRGHELKIYKKHSRLNTRKYFFSQRVVNDWNKLSKEATEAKDVNKFKNYIDKEFHQGGLYMI